MMTARNPMQSAIVVLAQAFVLGGGLSGCGTRTLESVASAMAVTTQTERAQERAELQALAEKSATEEKAPQLETEAAYLHVVAQLQSKQLWFASLAHLDVLERTWKPSGTSQLLRADAMRHMGMTKESYAIYQRLVTGSKAGKALHGIGLIAAQSQQYDEAVRQLSAARALAPTDAVLLSDLGFALLHTMQGSAARIPLMQAAQLQPGNVRIQSNVALYLVLHGEAQDASRWMQQHQMGESQRAQVFALAQQLASVPAAVESPVVEAVVQAEQAPEKTPAMAPEYAPVHNVQTATASPTRSQWMIETSQLKGRP